MSDSIEGARRGMLRVRWKTAAGGLAITALALALAWLRSPAPSTNSGMGPTVETRGVIVAIDPAARSFTMAGPQGTQEFYVTAGTVIDVGGEERIVFRDLAKFVGIPGTVRSADTGAYQYASRVTVLVMPARGVLPVVPRDRTDPAGMKGAGSK